MILVDTREHKEQWERVKAQFDRIGVKYDRSKLYVGDYQSLDNARLVVDRKQHLGELCSNVCQQHERFRAELVRAQEAGIKLVILCEHGGEIRSLEDVYFWINPRHKYSKAAMQGQQLFKILNTMRTKYGVDFQFCTKQQTGRRIAEILGEEN